MRDDPEHMATLRAQEIEPIDLVCVNLYPFERTVARRDVAEEEAIENIDIGGPTMIRAAAKNHRFVAVVVKPESYDAVLAELEETGGELSAATRHWLANEAFAYTARYDAAISRWFAATLRGASPSALGDGLREGARPLLRREPAPAGGPLRRSRGQRRTCSRGWRSSTAKPLSFNNVLDLDSARRCSTTSSGPACVIVKHNNPCGVGDRRRRARAPTRRPSPATRCPPSAA